MSDYESGDLTGSAPYFVADPPPTSANRRSARLASCPTLPSPSSQLRANGIIPGSDVEPSQLVQLVELLSHHDSPFSPPPPPVSSGKRLRKSANPPAKRREVAQLRHPPPLLLPISSHRTSIGSCFYIISPSYSTCIHCFHGLPATLYFFPNTPSPELHYQHCHVSCSTSTCPSRRPGRF
ncbi:hypothetical protein CRENBAI_020921 [Crenichthys baileyi]|uniref:Uncharacterized protein n=1 Tax=Crenichthys baileyi TaxID=28760 RepID=A0AAV9RX10_9TELE